MKKLALGIQRDISNEDYHADREYISSSGLKYMLNDPQEFYDYYITGKKKFKGSDAMDLGTYVHSLVLEPDDVDQYVFFDGAKRYGKAWDKFKEENKEKFILLRAAREKGFYCAEAIKDNEHAQELLKEGEAELTVTTTLLDVPVKVRFDWLGSAHISDVKTSYKCGSIESIEAIIQERDYDLSAALYCDAYEKVRGIAPDFSFIFVNTTDFTVKTVKCSPELLENGRRKYKCALKRLKIARETGNYIPEESLTVTVPKNQEFWESCSTSEKNCITQSDLNVPSLNGNPLGGTTGK